VNYEAIIADKTDGEIRTFLDEIANGTSSYRSLQSLTEQIEHQYHGRFLIELIQNAHDALTGSKDHKNRISITLNESEGDFGVLYVANDGYPFVEKDFNSLCKLAQSSKDPEESIGNKGIGFRSVLQIATSPEIYSRSSISSTGFDGFCFQFNPNVKKKYNPAIQCLLNGDSEYINSPLSKNKALIDWSKNRINAFREICKKQKTDWFESEFSALSPYLLPLPIERDLNSSTLNAFMSQGFSTVLRLPLLSRNALILTKEKIEDLNEQTILFLDKVTHLLVDMGRTQKIFMRKSSPLDSGKENAYEVNLECSYDTKNSKVTPKIFWVWSRTITGEKLSLTVKELPGKWPKLQKATVSLALNLGDEPEDGKLSIYLPTELNSGCSAFFNAPFYGNMSRTEISFEEPVNKLFLDNIANIAVTDAMSSLFGKKEIGARCIIDLVTPSSGECGQRWRSALSRETQLKERSIILTDIGWKTIDEAKLLPCLDSLKIINESMIRRMVGVPIIHHGIMCRTQKLKQLFESLSINGSVPKAELATVVESVARYLLNDCKSPDWNSFWCDVEFIMESNIDELSGKEIILGTDNRLHSSKKNCSVFFRPQRGGDDDDVLSDANLEDIPENLGLYIAFLSDKIQIHEPGDKGRNKNNATHRFLSSGLVEPKFGVEQILRNVLIPCTPILPILYNENGDGLCRDILRWGIKLVLNSRQSRDKTVSYLKKLPVPCIGGWFPIEETSFGIGWSNSVGKYLDEYLSGANTIDSLYARDRLLLPPDNFNWGGIGERAFELLKQAGVMDGLRPIVIGDGWDPLFDVSGCSGEGVNIPATPPSCFLADLWQSYREYVESTQNPRYEGNFQYEFINPLGLPGFDVFDKMNETIKQSLMHVLMASMPTWKNWRRCKLKKVSGASHAYDVESPLFYMLSNSPWLIGHTENKKIQCAPKERWYIPSATMVGRAHHFSHLMLLPKSISRLLDKNADLECSMRKLGMPKYDPEVSTDSPRLLDDLAKSLSHLEMISNHDVFLGQIRSAWKAFVPNEDNIFPSSIIIRDKSGALMAINPTEDEPIFLPDANDAIHEGLKLNGKPIVVIDNPRSSSDAKRLKGNFFDAFGSKVQLASELEVEVLVDGYLWQPDERMPLITEVMPWLPPVVLTIFAFHGAQSKGTGTKSFSDAIKQLRNARYLCADKLETTLVHKGKAIASTHLHSLWVNKEHTLIVENKAEEDSSLMSDAIASLVDRVDMDTPLQLILSNVSKDVGHSEDEMQKAFKKMKISANDYSQVKQEWLGDCGWKVQLLRSLVLLLNPDSDSRMFDDMDERNFENFLKTISLSPLNVNQVMGLIHEASDIKHFGQAVYRELGGKGELSRWNNVLSKLGESLIKNESVDNEFADHLLAAKIALRSVIGSTMSGTMVDGFLFLDKQLFNELKCPNSYAEKYWEIDFSLAMDVVVGKLSEWNVNRALLEAVRESKSVDELCVKLNEQGLELDVDPIEIQANNQKEFTRVLTYIQKVIIAWCLKNGIDTKRWEFFPTDMWKKLPNNYFAREAYSRRWDTLFCIKRIRELNISSADQEVSCALDTSAELTDFRTKLGVLESEINNVTAELEKKKEVLAQQKKTVDVCGKEFINDDSNLGDLFDHLTEQIEDNVLPNLSIRKTEVLQDIPSRKPRVPKKRAVGGKQIKRPTQAMKNLVGLAGEIHAYRVLKKKFGNFFGPSCWVSENSRYKFPENSRDDGRGCDFEIRYNNKTYYFEVKASQGDDETFELGSSEVRLAINASKGRTKRYFILHILNALSDAPDFFLLPNPYDNKNAGKYRFEGTGFRLRYLAIKKK